MENNTPSPKQKALTINLDDSLYGTFAEIGAGQETARAFFQAGGASGTIAKTISAYDMVFSDNLYGVSKSKRYVSRDRLLQMLDAEYYTLNNVLSGNKKDNTRLFVFANTISALNYRKDNFCHGWIGVRFQITPGSKPNDVILHVRMHENDNLLQQKSLGIFGVNLIYACFFYYQRPNHFLKSLMDHLTTDRIEVDMINMRGPDMSYVDNRLLSVQLVKNKMTDVAMFDRNGDVQQPADVFYKKNVMVIRGSFRPITYVGFDMLKSGFALFKKDVGFDKKKTVVFCEITMRNLLKEGDFDERDFLSRVDLLTGMGQNVMISNFKEFYKLTDYLSQFNINHLRVVIGILTLTKILDENYYSTLSGGILEALARLFRKNTRLYVYPALDNKMTTDIRSLDNFEIPENIKHLFRHLIENQQMIPIKDVRHQILHIFSKDVLQKIKQKDPSWQSMVPVYIAKRIKEKKLFM